MTDEDRKKLEQDRETTMITAMVGFLIFCVSVASLIGGMYFQVKMYEENTNTISYLLLWGIIAAFIAIFLEICAFVSAAFNGFYLSLWQEKKR